MSVFTRLALAAEEALLAVLFKRQCERRDAFYRAVRSQIVEFDGPRYGPEMTRWANERIGKSKQGLN